MVTKIFIAGVTLLTFTIIVLIGVVNMRRLPWPKGTRFERTSVLGVDLIFFDIPGADGERLLLLDACQTATTALFTAWRTWRPLDVGAETVIPKLGVHFVDDKLMDDMGPALFGKNVAAYLTDVASAFERVPMAVIRKSCVREMIETGQPLIHELLHALLRHYLPNEKGNDDHTHLAWDLVQGVAVSTFKDLYSPAARKRRG